MASVVPGLIGLWPQNVLLKFRAERRKLTLFLLHGRMTLVHDLYLKNLASIVNKLIYGLLTFCKNLELNNGTLYCYIGGL